MNPLLFIGIPTIPERAAARAKLVARLRGHASGSIVKVHIMETPHVRAGGLPIAEKRNLINRAAAANGAAFVVQIDDDDMVPENYVGTMLEAIQKYGPGIDTIGHLIAVKAAGHPDKLASVSYRHKGWTESPVGRYQYRQHTYYKVPIKTTIAARCEVRPDMRFGEDALFSQRIEARQMIRAELFIPEVLYTYNMPPRSANPHIRYGI
jgi:hypothetical protein